MAQKSPQVHYRKSVNMPDRRFSPQSLIVMAIVAVLLVMLVYGIASVVKLPEPGSGQETAATPAQQGAVQSAEQTVVQNAEQGAEQNAGQAGASDQATQPAANLEGRDADFAVDPARTDWNFGTNGRKTVYLTIDDGPSDKTQQVLDILDRYGCKATFFVVGHNPDAYPMIAEAYRRGHTIGLHTYSHDYAEVYASPDAYFADLEAIGQVVKNQIGFVPCFIRFPGGSSNAVSADYCPGIMTQLVEDVQARGYQYYDWNLSVGDGSDHTTEEIIGYGTAAGDDENIMLLCHDSTTKQTTVDALPAIIEHYQALGYTFEAIDRESWVCHHGVSN